MISYPPHGGEPRIVYIGDILDLRAEWLGSWIRRVFGSKEAVLTNSRPTWQRRRHKLRRLQFVWNGPGDWDRSHQNQSKWT